MSSASGRILVVDDDEAVLRAVSQFLQRGGHHVVMAQSGDAALVHLARDRFDAVVSDISMPGMTGLELLRRVRMHDLDVPVILMTGVPDVTGAATAVEYGALRYLTKPVVPSVLLPVVEDALRKGRLARVKRDALALVGDPEKFVGDRAALDAHFSLALESLLVAYQPIVRWPDGSRFAYEALLRTSAGTLSTPMAVLNAAEQLGRVHDLGRAIRAVIARDAASIPEPCRIFVNLHPLDLSDTALVSASAPLSAWASRITLEITERATMDGIDHLSSTLQQLRSMGYQVALDDLGAGYAGLVTFERLQPEVVKVDMALVRGIDVSPTKQKVVETMTRLAREMRMAVIVEGVETVEERDTLMGLGCDLFQGYLFGKPVPLSQARESRD